MASKEATVFIVDVGSTMGEVSHGRDKSNLDWALEYVWDRITSIISTNRKTNMVGVVGLRTDKTENPLDEEEDYHHITVFQSIGQMLMPQLRKLRQDLVISNTDTGDATSALVVAIQMISETCKKLQYMRRIVLVTDARAPIHTDDMSQITEKIKEDKIELTILGVDFDDPEYGSKEESKPEIKAEHEVLLRTLCEDCGGNFGTLAQAIEEMEMPRLKTTRPVHSYKGFITLGNPQTYETAMSIDIERYPKTMKATAPSASSLVLRNGMAATQSTGTSATLDNGDPANGDGDHDLTAVRQARTYQIADANAPGGKRDITPDDLSKGYEYGRTAVHISESDRNVTTFETQTGLDIVGFVDRNQYEHYLEMSRVNMIIAARTNEKASMALSSLIHALYELDSYAVARFVAKENREPRMLLLAPNVEPDFECLYDIELPFAEDVRSYRFPPLDRVVTVSGNHLKVHRNLPNDDLQDAMSAYVDKMDLSEFEIGEDGQATQYMPIDETYNPKIHRLNQVIKHRAVFPESDPPPPYAIITKYQHPPAELVKTAASALEKVIEAADVKKVPPKARGKRFGRKEPSKPLSNLDVAALLADDPKRKQKKLDANNAVPEFKQLLENADTIEALHEAPKQLKQIIFDWIRHSVGDTNYGRAIEAMRVMREEMSGLDEPGPYNDFLKELKTKVLASELGGDRKDLWYRVRVNKLTPITKRECQESEYDDEQAKEFMFPR